MASEVVQAFETLILRRIVTKGQARLADALGCDDSKISRFLSGQEGMKLKAFGQLIEALGLECIETDGASVTISRDEYEALCTLTRKAVTE